MVGTLLGVLSSRRPNGLLSQCITVLSLVGFAAPVFWTGMLLVLAFASWWPVLPVSGMRSADAAGGAGLADLLDVARHLVLPALTLALVYLAQYSRLSRSSMLDVLGADYIRTARAKGLAEHVVLYRHALRNALLPVVTMLGLQFGNVMAGAIIVETVFNWPGLGRLAFDSVLRRDYPTILGVLLFSSIVVVVMNLVTDLCYRLIDPASRRPETMNAITPPSVSVPSVAAPQAAAHAEHPAREALRMFLRNPSAIAGMAMLLIVLLVAIAGPWIWPADPFEIRTMPLSPPFSEEAWLGSDQLGRDVLTGIIHGGRATLMVGAFAALLSVCIGVTLGAMAGYYGGRVDALLMRVTEFFQVLPALLFAMVVVTLFSPSLVTVTLAIGSVSWPATARLTRAEFMRIRQLEFVRAESAIGAPRPHHLEGDPAQCAAAAGGVGHAGRGRRHPVRGRPVLPGPG